MLLLTNSMIMRLWDSAALSWDIVLKDFIIELIIFVYNNLGLISNYFLQNNLTKRSS